MEEKLKEMEFLASCASYYQLGYILLKCIVPDVKAASSGEHVFLVMRVFRRIQEYLLISVLIRL